MDTAFTVSMSCVTSGISAADRVRTVQVAVDDGTMARFPDLEKFSEKHGVKLVTGAQIIEYRRQRNALVSCPDETRFSTKFGIFRLRSYESESDGLTHLALLAGEPEGTESATVRMHSSCPMDEVIRSARCECRAVLGPRCGASGGRATVSSTSSTNTEGRAYLAR